MSILDFLLILFVVYLFYIVYKSELDRTCKKKKEKERCLCLENINEDEKDKQENLEDPKDITAARKEADPTIASIEEIVDEYRSPFYHGDSTDINTKLSFYHSSYGSRDRDSKIGNHNMVYVKELNKIHTPLLNYYDNRDWFERDTQHDFDMFLK